MTRNRIHVCQLQALTDALTPILQAIRQTEYYTNPRFHASFAWALLDRHASGASSGAELGDMNCTPPSAALEADFPTIPHLPHDLVSILNAHHSVKLSSPKTGTFDVKEVTIKIGKEVYTWHLSG